MDSSGIYRDQFTSLVGAVPLADVLADLPLPVALPTPTEESILGATKKLSADTKRLLDSTSSTVCSKVTETLVAVDMGFLDFKEPCQTVPLAPSMKAPPLINALVSHDLFPQPVVRLEKLDLTQYKSPIRSSGYPVQDAVVPLQATQGVGIENDEPRKKKKKRKQRPVDLSSQSDAALQKVIHKPKRRRLSSSSSGETQVRPRKPPRPKQKGGSALRVSIGRSRLSEPSSPTESMMTVQVPRSKLRGSLGHGHQRSSFNPMYPSVHSDVPYDVLGNVEGVQYQGAINVRADQVVPGEKPPKAHKKKKKHSRRSGDPTKMANLQRFTDVLESV